MLYYKKIAYIDYLENDIKIRNAGFVKIEKTGGDCMLTMQVKGLADRDCGVKEICDHKGEPIGTVQLKGGTGYWKTVYRLCENDQEEGPREVRIRLSPGRSLKAALEDNTVRQESKAVIYSPGHYSRTNESAPVRSRAKEMEEKSGIPGREVFLPQNGPGDEGTDGSEDVERPSEFFHTVQTEPVLVKTESQAKERVIYTKAAESVPETAPCRERFVQPAAERESAEELRRILTEEKGKQKQCRQCPRNMPPTGEEFYADKWEQLRHNYPVIHPFGDERAYLSIGPNDFIILESSFQKMVHNSFLLHGYYNYRHVILGKINVEGEENYYLGVPGVYYDKEKMVAEMFGFEAFEGQNTPAEPGCFGYYMKKVRI